MTRLRVNQGSVWLIIYVRGHDTVAIGVWRFMNILGGDEA